MSNRRTLITFFLALAAFVAGGGGALLLLAPRGAAGAIDRALAATASPSGSEQHTDEPAATGSAEPAGPNEFVIVENAPAITRPDQPGRIVIPSIALDARVVEVGIVVENGKPVWDTAAFAVGFHRGTALPGHIGNAVMAGHISSPVSRKGDVFKRLPEVRIGDRVEVYVGDKKIAYEVAELKIVSSSAVGVMNQTEDATLTLITCYPNGVYNKRLVVVGKLIG
jgi:sortase A